MKSSNLYIVTQEPKRGNREGLVVRVMVTTATSAAGALRLTARHFVSENYFRKPQAFLLIENQLYRL